MDMDLGLIILLGAIGGGMFGAAVGALPSFIFTGFTVLAGTAIGFAGGDYDFLGNVAFGPVFGPHIAFGGGVAAAAYAKKVGGVEDGKDIAAPMAGLANPMVLAIGGLFGLIGHVGQQLIAISIGDYTDGVALMVAISCIISRLAFGRTGPIGTLSPEAAQRGRFVPGGDNVWAPFQESLLQAATIGIGAGLLSSWIVGSTWEQVGPEAAGAFAVVVGFGISAASLIFLQVGFSGPITHHMTLPAGVATFQMLDAGIAVEGAVIVGVIFGAIGALLGEFFSRLFLIHGDTFIDPPANAIWSATTIAILLGMAVGAVM